MKMDKSVKDQAIGHYKNELISVCEKYSSEFGAAAPVSTLTALLCSYMSEEGMTVDELAKSASDVLKVVTFITEVHELAICLKTTKEYQPC